MKTALRAKVIIDSNKLDHWSKKKNPATIDKIVKLLNTSKFKLEVIDDGMTNHYEPVFYFKIK